VTLSEPQTAYGLLGVRRIALSSKGIQLLLEPPKIMTSSFIERNNAVAEPVFDLSRAKPSESPTGTTTDEWFAVGDTSGSLATPSFESVAPVPVRRSSPRRRLLVRLVGCLAIGGTVGCLVRLAAHAPFRHAILDWGLFGQSERLYPADHRTAISR